jgi:hypothetical protein
VKQGIINLNVNFDEITYVTSLLYICILHRLAIEEYFIRCV